MWILANIATATSVCVPADFQHWQCDQTAATPQTAYAAVDGSAGPHTIHLRWDVDHTSRITLDSQDLITFRGHPGPAGERPSIRGFTPTGATVTLRGLDLPMDDDARALSIANDSDVTLVDVDIKKDDAGHTGNQPAIHIDGGTLTATDLTIATWNTDVIGAHIQAYGDASIVLNDSVLDDARGADAGAVHLEATSSLVMNGGAITNARSDSKGGAAIRLKGSAQATLNGTRLEGNVSVGTGGESGGAIHLNDDANTLITDKALFCGNTTAEEGGAIHVANGDIDVRRTLFYNNNATKHGGAIHVANTATADALIDHCTFDGNDGDNRDDAIHQDNTPGRVDIHSSIFLDHTLEAIHGGDEVFNNLFWSTSVATPRTDIDKHHDPTGDSVVTNPVDNNHYHAEDPELDEDQCSRAAYIPHCDNVYPIDGGADELNIGAVLRCNTADGDSDGLMDHEEIALGTDPAVADSDNDGYPDGVECPPALTAPLNNPSFESSANVLNYIGGFATVDENEVPGWFTDDPAGTLTLADDTGYGAGSPAHGTNGVEIGAQPVYQQVEVEHGEALVVGFTVFNPGPGSRTVTVDADGTTQAFPVGNNSEARLYLPFTAGPDPDALASRIEFTATGAMYVDQVYVGLANDTDGDDTLNCLDTDSDGDNIDDMQEFTLGLDPLSTDTDGDGFPDQTDGARLVADTDDDGLPDWYEDVIGTNKGDADSDGDGFDDGLECGVHTVNGSFEYVRHRRTGDTEIYLNAEVPGWFNTAGDEFQISTGSDFPAAPHGTYIAELNGLNPGTFRQTVTTVPGETYRWAYQHRGRYGSETIAFEITNVAGTADTHTADDLSWTEHSGTFVATSAQAIFEFESTATTFPNHGNLIDDFVVIPASEFAGGTPGADYATLACRDMTNVPDQDGDGITSDEDCDDFDHTVGAPEPFYVDGDGDGIGGGALMDLCPATNHVIVGNDCDDGDSGRYPGNTEICFDGIDQDCLAGDLMLYFDDDNDGYGDGQIPGTCASSPLSAATNDDCNDSNAQIYPGATEVCNAVDDNCDGTLDEGLPTNTYYVDSDSDGYGNVEVEDCAGDPPTGAVRDDGDCDDNDDAVNPAALELCNQADDNCNGNTDEGLPTNTYFVDGDNDGFGNVEVEDCAGDPPIGAVRDGGDCNDAEPLVNPMAQEVCNNIDDDCAGGIDDGLTFTDYFEDDDGDNYGVALLSSCEPTAPAGYGDFPGDCDDTVHTTYPGATEICNGVDDDCVGGIDDGLTFTDYYEDNDGDNYGVALLHSCEPTAPAGYGDFPGDCDDNVDTTYPDAIEICNGVDDDCDGVPDDNLQDETYYFDSDSDGFGGINDLTTCMIPPAGYVLIDGDCDDADGTINPGEDELCDAIDQNCDGSATAGAIDALPFYLDVDLDGYGTPAVEIFECAAPPQYVADDTDCNDALIDVNPGASERCNTVFDDDCDGEINEDDAIDALTYYTDADGDGSGTAVTTTACSRPAGFSSTLGPDCDDADPNNFPGGIEQCDGADNNCNTTIDDDVVDQIFYADNDSDGFGDPDTSNLQCAPDVLYPLLNSDDCDDDSGLVNPDAAEVCDGIDNNCFAGEADASDADVFFPDEDEDGYGNGADPIIACTAGPMQSADSGDCDDANPFINPAATEVCDGADNDCNGLIDIDSDQVLDWYLDTDLDGFGTGLAVFACDSPGNNYTRFTNDCDDSDGTVYPGALEVCDQVDNDCDLAVDITDPDYTGPSSTYYADTDGDMHGDADAPLESCENSPPDGYTTSDDDCLDTDATVSPTAPELFCDGIDQDCSGDLESSSQGYPDADGDGYGGGAELCDDNADLVPDGGDCDDADRAVNPGEEEICGNGIDDDCAAGDEVCTIEVPDYVNSGCDCETGTGPSWAGMGMLLLLAGSLRRRRSA